MYTVRCRVRTSTTRVSTSASAYISLARVRVYTFALSQDRARMNVFVRSWDACYRRGWYAYPPIRRRHNDETNCYNNFIYREGKIMYTPRIPLSDACICDGHGLMTTIEFPCSNPLRAFSPHDTYRGRNSDAHAITMLPLRRHVGYVHHVMLTRPLSPSISSMMFPRGSLKITPRIREYRETFYSNFFFL